MLTPSCHNHDSFNKHITPESLFLFCSITGLFLSQHILLHSRNNHYPSSLSCSRCSSFPKHNKSILATSTSRFKIHAFPSISPSAGDVVSHAFYGCDNCTNYCRSAVMFTYGANPGTSQPSKAFSLWRNREFQRAQAMPIIDAVSLQIRAVSLAVHDYA